MRLQRLWIVGFVTAALAGCGGSSSSGDGSADPAQAVPAGVPVYVEGAVRPEGDQGDAARALIGKFLPPGTTLTQLIDDQIKQQGDTETYEKDIEPWLGQRVAVGVTNLTGDSPTYYGAVAITDADKAAAFLGKEGKERGEYADAKLFQDDDTWAGVKGDYISFAGNEADVKKAIDAAGGDSIGDTQVFKDAVDELPDERLGALFVDMRKFGDLVASQPDVDPAARAILQKFFNEDTKPLTAALTVTDASATVESRVSGGLGALGIFGAGRATDLIEDAPADAFAAFGVADVGPSLKDLLDRFAGALGGAALTGQLESQTGINLERDVFSWIGDLAVYVRGDSLSALNGALVIGVRDEDAAKQAIPRIVAAAQRSGAPVRKADVQGADEAYAVAAPGAPGPVVLARGSGRVALAFGAEAAAEALSPPSDTLGDSGRFADAKEAIDGLEPSLVLSLPTVLKLVEESGQTDSDYAQAKRYLDKLDLVVTGSEKDGDAVRSLFTVTTR